VLVDRQRCCVLWQAFRHLRRPVPTSAHPHGLRTGCGTECSGRRRNTAQSSAIPAHLPHPAAESAVGGPLSSVWKALDAAALVGATRHARPTPASGPGPVLCTVLVIRSQDGILTSVVGGRRSFGGKLFGLQSNPSFLLSRRRISMCFLVYMYDSLVKRKASDLMYCSYIQMCLQFSLRSLASRYYSI